MLLTLNSRVLASTDDQVTIIPRRVSLVVGRGDSNQTGSYPRAVRPEVRILLGISPNPLSNRLVVQHQLAMLEVLDREELQVLLFQHRTPVMGFPASKDDRHHKDTVVIGQSPLHERLH